MASNANNKNIFFMLPECATCQNLAELLKNEGILNNFQVINVEKLQKIPEALTDVPTLIVAGIPKPLVVREAFIWLQNVKMIRQRSRVDMNKRIMYEMTKNMQFKDGPKGFSSNEMLGFSDNFAYQNENINQDKSQAQAKSFFSYKDEENNAILTGEEYGEKLKETDQAKLLESIEKQRQDTESQYKLHMKQEQIKEVMKSEQERILAERYGK
jgi:ribosomal protein S8